jgi:hypothetical protein
MDKGNKDNIDRDRRRLLYLMGLGASALIALDVIEALKLDRLFGGNETATVTKTETATVYSNTTVTETETVTQTQTVTQTSTQTCPTTTQPPQSLEQILFGNNNNMQFIPLKVTNVETDSNNAYLTVYDYLTNTQLQIALPIQYVSNGNINIENILSAVKDYNSNNGTNYGLYLVLGRAGLNQAIQQNGIWYLPASQIYYNILISDREGQDVYNALQNLLNGNATVVMPTSNQGPYSNSLWGWSNVNDESIIIEYQNGQQVNSVTNYINLADYILGTPNNSNPTSQGILHVDTIASTQESSVYQNQYPVYNVNNYFGTLIVLKQSQGYELFSNL